MILTHHTHHNGMRERNDQVFKTRALDLDFFFTINDQIASFVQTVPNKQKTKTKCHCLVVNGRANSFFFLVSGQ